jgi:transcriptional regulator with XRE-family HTH domain
MSPRASPFGRTLRLQRYPPPPSQFLDRVHMPRRNQTPPTPPGRHRAPRQRQRESQLRGTTEPIDDDLSPQDHSQTSDRSGANASITHNASEPQAASEIGRRLREIRTRAGLTVRALADLLDLAPTTVQSWEARSTTKPLPPAVVERLCATLAGRGNPPVTQNELTALAAWWSTEPVAAPSPNAIRQPYAPLSASTAHIRLIPARPLRWGVMAMDGGTARTTPAPTALAANPDAFAVVMQDNSMAPRYDAGDVLYCDPARPPHIGAYAIAITQDGHGFVGQLAAASAEHLTLRTLNPPQEHHVPASNVATLARILTTADILSA